MLEIGAGAGANFGLLAPEVEYVGAEPHRASRDRLRRAVPPGAVVVDAAAEALPFADGELDAVLATVVLCSVRSPDRAVAEVRRVLRPGGRFVFFEHVAAPRGSRRRAVQRLVAPVSRVVDRGCDPARETWAVLERAGFARLEYDVYDLRLGAFAPGPHLAGVGVR